MAHRKVIGTALLAIVLALTAVAPAAAGGGGGGGTSRIVTFDITLTGAAEVPGPGDPDGTGVAQVNVIAKAGRTICFAIAVEGITLPATAAHIHQAAAGVAGGVVVTLAPPQPFGSGTTGVSAGCVTGLSNSLLSNIVQHPEQYYVNVHNADFPAGALRGQLA